jgi:hypothetical protein
MSNDEEDPLIREILDSLLPFLVSELARSADLLKQILNILENKRQAEAAEFNGLGLYALQNGWPDRAVIHFQRSIETWGDDPSVYFAMGYALAEEHNYQAAAKSFAEAARFGVPKPGDRPLAVSAAIFSAYLYDKVGERKHGLDVLTVCLRAIPSAAEVAYELARRVREQEREYLQAALSLKPTLIENAQADNLAERERVARDVLDDSPGFAGLQADAAHAYNELATLLEQAGRSVPERMEPLPTISPASARLSLFAVQLPQTRERLSSAIRDVRAYSDELKASARNSLQLADSAQSRLTKPVPPVEPDTTGNRTYFGCSGCFGILAAIWGVALVIYIISPLHHDTKPIVIRNLLISIVAPLILFVVLFLKFFLFEEGEEWSKDRENKAKYAAAQSLYRAEMEAYPKHLAAYESESRKGEELRSTASEASSRAEAFNEAASDRLPEAEEACMRLSWDIVEPIAMPFGPHTKSIGTD